MRYQLRRTSAATAIKLLLQEFVRLTEDQNVVEPVGRFSSDLKALQVFEDNGIAAPPLGEVAAEDIVIKTRLRPRAGTDHLRDIIGRHQVVLRIRVTQDAIGEQDEELPNRNMQTVLIAQFQQGAEAAANQWRLQEFVVTSDRALDPEELIRRSGSSRIAPTFVSRRRQC